MRHLFIGYALVYSSSLLSILLHWVSSELVRREENYMGLIMVHTGVNIAVLAVLIVGISLYVFGYKKNQIKVEDIDRNVVLSVLLILYGAFVTLVSVVFYDGLIKWSEWPGHRDLTIWDHSEYISAILTGGLWVVSSLILLVTSYREG
jgi:hypothetical protein